MSLGAALNASVREGQPVSAKFELDHGTLQLSIYIEKNKTFSEVVVDHQSGAVAKSERITGGEDLAAAKVESAALAKATVSLTEALARAVGKNSGYRAVRVVPSLRNGHPIARIDLVKGDKWITVTEKLE